MYHALIVEDEKLMRDYLLTQLSKIHPSWAAAGAAADGIEAVEVLAHERFDVVITDIRMPGMDGLELARYMRKEHPDTDVVILSGYDEFAYARSAMRLNVFDYLLKPLNDEELTATLSGLAVRVEKRKTSTVEPTNRFTNEPVSQHIALNSTYAIDADENLLKTVLEPTLSMLSQKARNYMQVHFREPISLSTMADALHVSSAYLSDVLHRETGESYSKRLLRLRMEDAALRLQTEPSIKVYEVGEAVGFPSSKHFAHVFRNYYQMTPKEYREQKLKGASTCPNIK